MAPKQLLAALTLVGLGVRTGAQSLPNPLPPSNPAPIVYVPPERLAAGPPNVNHVLNVYLPRGPLPPTGWPVVVGTGYGGGGSAPPLNVLRATGIEGAYWNLVASGIAVVHFGTPGIGNGRGLWYPAGHPSGRYESFRARDDSPEKSAEWVVQWVKTETQFPFDTARVALRGSSGGAVLAIRTAMGPERARATGSAQIRASTRVAAVLAIQPPTSAWALEQGPELTIAFPGHLERAAQPGVPATQLSQVSPDLEKAYSLMHVGFMTDDARTNNAHQPICLIYGDPVLRIGGAPATFALDASGFPVLFDAIKQPLQHDSWFGYAFWKRLTELSSASAAFHASNSVFAIRDTSALPPPLALHTRTFTGGVFDRAAVQIGHEWLLRRLLGARSVAAEGGAGLPGAGAGVPLVACGPLPSAELAGELRGDEFVLHLCGARGTSALLFAESAVTADPCAPGRGARAVHAVALEPSEGTTEIRLTLPPGVRADGVRVRALVREGAATARWTNSLVLGPALAPAAGAR